MKLLITTENGRKIELEQGVPESHQKLAIPATSVVSATESFGTLLFQEIEGKGFTIIYGNYIMYEDINLYIKAAEPFIGVNMSLKDHIFYSSESAGDVSLRENQFVIRYVPSIKTNNRFLANREYATFSINFHPEYLERMAEHFPLIRNLLDRVENQQPANITDTYHYATMEMLTIVQDILHCDFEGEIKKLYLDAKVTEYLIQLMDKASSLEKSPLVRLSPYDIDRIKEAREILLQHIENPLTIIDLAHKVGINDFKLKKGFRQLFGTSIFDYLLTIRMEKARHMLLESDKPVFEIAFSTGYRNVSNFTAAFKRSFGYSPSFLRKKK